MGNNDHVTHVCPRCKGAKFAHCLKRDATGIIVDAPERCAICNGTGVIYGRIARQVQTWPRELVCWS